MVHEDDEGQYRLLRQLATIRQRSYKVYDLAVQGKLDYFDYHPEKEEAVVQYCADILHRDYGEEYDSIPGHGRWRHLNAGGQRRVEGLVATWSKEANLTRIEMTRRLVELFIVAVLLDAGAGPDWKYTEPVTRDVYSRSEGLAVAAFHMFDRGVFSGDESNSHQVDETSLVALKAETIAHGLQADEKENPLAGLEGRSSLLTNLGQAIQRDQYGFFKAPEKGMASGRLGYLVDYLVGQSSLNEKGEVHMSLGTIWTVLLDGLSDIWPGDRIRLNGKSLGDVWPCEALIKSLKGGSEEEGYVPFHKLTQWMTYSILEPLEKVLGCCITGKEQLTGLPEYRNGGLFIDLGVLTPRPELFEASLRKAIPKNVVLPATHSAIVEWRCMTVVLLDRIADALNSRLDTEGPGLQLAQVLEAATWKGGREIAMQVRPPQGLPPIEVISDGAIF